MTFQSLQITLHKWLCPMCPGNAVWFHNHKGSATLTETDKCPSSQHHQFLVWHSPVTGMHTSLNPTPERSRAQLADPLSWVFKNRHPCLQCWKLTSSNLQRESQHTGFRGEHKFMCSYPALMLMFNGYRVSVMKNEKVLENLFCNMNMVKTTKLYTLKW